MKKISDEYLREHALKNPSATFEERDEEKRREFCEIIKDEKEDDIVYIDESGIKNTLKNKYAWSPRGESIHDETKGRTTEKLNIVEVFSKGEIIAPMMYECAMDSEIFNFWLEYQLLPDIPKNLLL